MITWVPLISLIAIYVQLVEGEYGEKLRGNNTGSSESLEELYDYSSEETAKEEPTTTLDDGVIIEKAILTAELHPEPSYSLVDHVDDNSVDDKQDSAIISRGSKKFFGYSESGDNDIEEFKTRFTPSSRTTETTTLFTRSPYRSPSRHSNFNRRRETVQNQEASYTTSWSPLSVKPINVVSQKPYSSTYTTSNDIDITTPMLADPQSTPGTTSDDGVYESYKNEEVSHLGYQNINQQPWYSYIPPSVNTLEPTPDLQAQVEEANWKFEEDRIAQIEAAKEYLKHVEAAKEYAAKVQALTAAIRQSFQSYSHPDSQTREEVEREETHLPPKSSNSQTGSYLSSSKPKSGSNTQQESYLPPSTSNNHHESYLPPTTSNTKQESYLPPLTSNTQHESYPPQSISNSQQGSYIPQTISNTQQEYYFPPSTSNSQQESYLPPTTSNSQQGSYVQPSTLNTQHESYPPQSISNTQQESYIPPSTSNSQQESYLPPTTSNSQQGSYVQPSTSNSQHESYLPSSPSGNQQGFYLSPSISNSQKHSTSTVVGRPEASGESNLGYQSNNQWPQDYSYQEPPSHVPQVNALVGAGWLGYSSQSDIPFQMMIPYSGPFAYPVVLPSGFLADTDEVTKARVAHLQALKNAIEASSLWKDPTPEQWS